MYIEEMNDKEIAKNAIKEAEMNKEERLEEEEKEAKR